MLRKTLFNIIRQEHREVANELEKEERRPSPDVHRLTALRQKATNLRREMEHFPDA